MSREHGGGSGEAASGVDDPGGHGDELYTREEYVLYCLARHGRMALSDLADEVVVWEFDAPLSDLPPSEVRTVYLSLVHTHVPRLERFGLVRHADQRGLVRLSEAARDLNPAEPSGEERPIRASSTEL